MPARAASAGAEQRDEREMPARLENPPEDSPSGLGGLGGPVGPCRRPLGKMTQPAVEKCRLALVAVRKSAPEFFKPIEAAFRVKVEDRLKNDSVWADLTRD